MAVRQHLPGLKRLALRSVYRTHAKTRLEMILWKQGAMAHSYDMPIRVVESRRPRPLREHRTAKGVMRYTCRSRMLSNREHLDHTIKVDSQCASWSFARFK
jgi:DNA-directed RNA polymerase subunit N (RpoN/RPB10)